MIEMLIKQMHVIFGYRSPWLLGRLFLLKRRNKRTWSLWRLASVACWPRFATAQRYSSLSVALPNRKYCQFGLMFEAFVCCIGLSTREIFGVPLRLDRSVAFAWMSRIRMLGKWRNWADITIDRFRSSELFDVVEDIVDLNGLWNALPIRFRLDRNKCWYCPRSLALNCRASEATCCTEMPRGDTSFVVLSVDRRLFRETGGAVLAADIVGTTWSFAYEYVCYKKKKQMIRLIVHSSLSFFMLTFFNFSLNGVSDDVVW